jgi:NADH dehydrogenase (ubiquinone) 1 alpha subcomplex subunit 2
MIVMWSCAIVDFYADFGVERGVRLEGLSEAQISKALEELGKVGASLKV